MSKSAKRSENIPYAPRVAPPDMSVPMDAPGCCGDSHRTCRRCMRNGHDNGLMYGKWKSQPAWAFEERECRCCGHYESRALPEGEERW